MASTKGEFNLANGNVRLVDHGPVGHGLKSGLPELPGELLPGILRRLSPAELHQALTKNLLPVAWLPHLVLYAKIGDHEVRTAGSGNPRIIASLSRDQFLNIVRLVLGLRLRIEASQGLYRRSPEFSALIRLNLAQILFALLFVFFVAFTNALLSREEFTLAFAFLFNLFFLLTLSLRLLWLVTGARPQPHQPVDIPTSELPVYTVLVPVFREIRVLPQLLRSLKALRYPEDKLDIKLVLEESDTVMQRALAKTQLPQHFEIIVVPAGKPQTKPRALAYALQFARGELLTIYDAEDIPEPLQLQKAAQKFAVGGPNLACLQAELGFYNPNENWLTRQFTIEYALLFGQMLPCLAQFNLPMPLGGTSNHFKVAALHDVGGWDPYNVTEDADLGFRLARFGYETDTLDSLTYEEANTRLGNWLAQRTRWLKGFLQTWLVHTRHPGQLLRDLGPAGAWVFLCSTFAVFASALLYPVFVLLTLRLFILAPAKEIHNLYGLAGGLALAVSVLGYGLAGYGAHVALRRKAITGWLLTILTMPCYWLLIGIAAWRAVWEFMVRPFHWNKTRHGLSAFARLPDGKSISTW